MSRTGVSHSWMVELQASVACILNHPATKHTATIRGTEVEQAHTMLATMSTMAADRSCVRLEKRNLKRNITAKFMDMPMSEAYPIIRMSSGIRAVVPTMSEAAARYTPPENWMMRTKKMNSHGLSRRGI